MSRENADLRLGMLWHGSGTWWLSRRWRPKTATCEQASRARGKRYSALAMSQHISLTLVLGRLCPLLTSLPWRLLWLLLMSSRAVEEKEKNQLKQAAQRRQDVQDYIRRQIVSTAHITLLPYLYNFGSPKSPTCWVFEEVDKNKHGVWLIGCHCVAGCAGAERQGKARRGAAKEVSGAGPCGRHRQSIQT